MKISAVILTLNEELTLANCIRSLSSCEEIVVLDSISTDDTRRVAEREGARVVERAFDNYAAQRNYGLCEIEYSTEWVLMVDADEVATPELLQEINELSEHEEDNVCIYRMRRKDMFMGKWLKRSSGYPTWFGRLVRIGRVRVEREINEEYVTDGNVRLLKEHLHHHPFSKGMAWWFERHNRYSTMEAKRLYLQSSAGDSVSWTNLISAIFSKDPAERRKVLKSYLYSTPGRPIIVFVYLYFIRLGFLDGSAGLRYTLLRTIYEYQINCKITELKR